MPAPPPSDTGRHARPARPRRRAPLRPGGPSPLERRLLAHEERLLALEQRVEALATRRLDPERVAERVAAEASGPVIRMIDQRVRQAERQLAQAQAQAEAVAAAAAGLAASPSASAEELAQIKKAIVSLQQLLARPSGELARGLINSPAFKEAFDARIRGVLDYVRGGNRPGS